MLFHSLFKISDECNPLVTTFTVPKREATFESVTATRKSQVNLAAFLSVTVSLPLWHSLIRPTGYCSIVSLNVNMVAATHWADLLKLVALKLSWQLTLINHGVFSERVHSWRWTLIGCSHTCKQEVSPGFSGLVSLSTKATVKRVQEPESSDLMQIICKCYGSLHLNISEWCELSRESPLCQLHCNTLRALRFILGTSVEAAVRHLYRYRVPPGKVISTKCCEKITMWSSDGAHTHPQQNTVFFGLTCCVCTLVELVEFQAVLTAIVSLGWGRGRFSEQTHPAGWGGVGPRSGASGHCPDQAGGGWEGCRWEREVSSHQKRNSNSCLMQANLWDYRVEVRGFV